MQGIDPVDAEKLVRDCVCSDCWGDLITSYDRVERSSSVSCSTAGCPNHGVVSKRFVEKREQKSAGELLEAKTALTMAGVLRSGKSEKQLLADLGY